MNPSKVATWAGILGIPSIVIWYVSQFQIVLNWLPASTDKWLPQTALALFLLFVLWLLIALAMGQGQIAKQLLAQGESEQDGLRSGLVPYREWIEQWLRETCRNQTHQGAPPLDLTKHEGCSFRDCYMNWSGLICAFERLPI